MTEDRLTLRKHLAALIGKFDSDWNVWSDLSDEYRNELAEAILADGWTKREEQQ